MKSFINQSDTEFFSSLGADVERTVSNFKIPKTNQLTIENVVDDDAEPIILDKKSYTGKVYLQLQKELKNFNDYLFIEYKNNNTNLPTTRLYPHNKKVLMFFSGENKLHPINELAGEFHHIFANYYWDDQNVTSIPLGYYSYSVGNYVPIEERLHEISFTGCLSKNRVPMAAALLGINKVLLFISFFFNSIKTFSTINTIVKWKRNRDIIFFTDNFAKGLSPEKYCEVLRHTKIIFSPKGWINTETFRMYEAMQHGCIVFTEKLPNRSYYKDIPVIQVNNWKEGLAFADKILQNEDLLKELSQKHKEFYENMLSPEATVKIIIEKLSKLDN